VVQKLGQVPDHKKQFALSEDILMPALDLEMQQWIQRLDQESRHSNCKLYFDTEAQSVFDEWLIKHEKTLGLAVSSILGKSSWQAS
jgi:hypothetical protein